MNNYEIDPDDNTKAFLYITGNKINGVVLIDTVDIERLSKHQWAIKDKVLDNHKHYVAAKINNRTVKMHRFLLGTTDRNIIVDHRDRDTLNNRKENLKEVTYSENNHNTKKRRVNVSGRTGVCLRKGTIAKSGNKRSDSWVAQVQIDGKIYMKSFAISLFENSDAAKAAAEKQRLKWETKFGILTDK